MPGPVEVKANVYQAFKDSVVSHRSEEFIRDFFLLKDKLTGIVESRFAQIFMGSGTMANDVIAAQLKQIPGTGLIISNGEFGERLIDHAKSADIDFDQIILEFHDPDDDPNSGWIHCSYRNDGTNRHTGLIINKKTKGKYLPWKP